MNIENKKLTVEIFNDQYHLLSDESQEALLEASTLVDALMKEIAEKSSLQDDKRIAVLAALRIASKLVRLESAYQQGIEKQKALAELIDKKGLSSSL